MQLNTVLNINDLKLFFDKVDFLHDALLREFRFVSGGYVDEDGYMFGENETGICKMIIHSQNPDSPVIYIEIIGVRLARIDIRFPLELDGTITDKGVNLYFAGEYLKNDFVVAGDLLKYCILDKSYRGLNTRWEQDLSKEEN